MSLIDLEELRMFLSDSAPDEIHLDDPEQVDLEARRLTLLAQVGLQMINDARQDGLIRRLFDVPEEDHAARHRAHVKLGEAMAAATKQRDAAAIEGGGA